MYIYIFERYIFEKRERSNFKHFACALYYSVQALSLRPSTENTKLVASKQESSALERAAINGRYAAAAKRESL
jgi:hypothetical protein